MVVTLRQIADRRQVSYRAIKRRRDKEGWQSAGLRLVNHKEAEVFRAEGLPDDLKELFSNIAPNEVEMESEAYARAPEWARRKADKYLLILKASEGLKGDALRSFVMDWNQRHPEYKTSYPRLVDARKIYREQGVYGLLAKYGKASGRSSIKSDWLSYFKSVYLVEGAPSLKSCWIKTLGFAKTYDSRIAVESFPSPRTFLRKLQREIPMSSIFLARHGREAWNRRYGTYIDRDYTGLRPGECLVSDHAQVDVAVLLPNGKVCFPWVTAWRDFKSGKWVGWLHHAEAPNSDHVFQSFYYAAQRFGLPSDVYIDNGKDYRCRDFAGGRRNHRLSLDEARATSMLGLLNITPHFSMPRNAQAKAIERDFLKCKEWFSKHMPGYRGGNVKERPEKLKNEIRSGSILSFEEYERLMDAFITDVLNRTPINGKVHHGMSPDELWDSERTMCVMVSPDALKMFCMRTSRPLMVGRNGVRDSEAGVAYWAEWMSGMKGEKVYLRRDVKAYQEAWAFRARDDEYLGKAYLAEQAAALARTPIEKAHLRAMLERKRLMERVTKAYISVKDAPRPSESISHMIAGARMLSAGRETMNKAVPITRINTKMDKALKVDRLMGEINMHELSCIQPPEADEMRLYLYESDMEQHEER